MWREKTLIARQRLAKDFGTVVQEFSRRPDSREQYDSDMRLWRGWILVTETSLESAWKISLFGEETTSRPFYAMLSGKPPRNVKNYCINILAVRLVDDTIKLAVQDDIEHWSKLEGLWKKLWAELGQQGYKEESALDVASPVVKNQPATTACYTVPWDVAVLPTGLTEVKDFFDHGWDFAVPPFESKDGKQLKLDNAVMASTDIHKVPARDPEGRTIITLNAMTQNPDGGSWDLASATPVIQFILEPLATRTRVEVVLLERGAGQFLCVVLDRLISAYPQSERAIQQLIDFVADYCNLGVNRADSDLPDVMLQTTVAENGDPMTSSESQVSSSSALPDYKRKALEQRRADLIEEYEAVSAQLRHTLSAAHEVKLKRQQRHLEEQIADVESELGEVSPVSAPLPMQGSAQAGYEFASQSDQRVESAQLSSDPAVTPSSRSGAIPATRRPLRVFLSHASEDKPRVREAYRKLVAQGIDAWLDEEKLLPGQDWQLEIRKAVKSSDVVLVFLSQKAVTKTGYVQKEIRQALDVADEQPEGAIFLIPVKLEACDTPDRLSRVQWVNLYEESGWDRLMRALQQRMQDIGVG